MASVWAFSSSPFISISNNTSLRRENNIVACEKLLIHKNKVTDLIPTTDTSVRRSGNYPPSLWSYDQVQSLTSKYKGEKHMPRSETLKETIRTMIYKDHEKEFMNPLKILNLVDDLQRLGISYHFENEISNVLKNIYRKYYETPEKWTNLDLNLKSLGFRLLRQHGYHIPQEIFEDIKDDSGNFRGDLQKDILGMLNLYEASYHSLEEEPILDEARDFTTKYLNQSLDHNIDDEHLSSLTSHALDIPLHWMVPRVESKWFIGVYEKRTGMNPTLLELAKLDYNILQAIHQEDLKYTSRWWNNTTWDTSLSFVRDRLVENFLWAVGANSLPQFGSLRRVLAQIFALTTTIDDVYDVYGTLEELEQFTEAVCRWDINAIEELPEYMKICFVGLYNTINEMSYSTLTDKGFFNLSYLKKTWGDLCKAYLKEARWYNSGYKPTLEEYIENAYVSITHPVMLTHISFFTSVDSTDEILQSWERTENIIRYSGMILRLADDLGTYTEEMEKGDNPKSVQCYMHETGASEEEARMYVKTLILNTWKKLNKERSDVVNSQFLKEFTDCGSNLARMGQFFYHKGDGFGHRAHVTKSHIQSMLVNPM